MAARAQGRSDRRRTTASRSARPVQRSAMAPWLRQTLRDRSAVAAQVPAAPRAALTTTAARAQSSAKASTASAIDDEPAVGQPADAADRHRSARRRRALVLRARGRRRRPPAIPCSAKVSLPLCSTASRPSAPRTATPSAVGGDQHVGLRRRQRPQRRRRRPATAPLQRSGVRSRHDQQQPERCRAAAARCRRRAMRPTAPGRLATQSATAIIQSMPAPISRQKQRVEAERHRDQRRGCPSASPRRHDRHGQQVGDHAVGRERGGNGRPHRAWSRGRRPARRAISADDLAPAPQRDARAERGVGARRSHGSPY